MSDVHAHYCRRCRAPWEHDGELADTNPAIKAAHQCPTCGYPGWVKYYGTETHDEMCELEALLELSEDDRAPVQLRRQAGRDFRSMAHKLHRPGEPELSEESQQAHEALLDLLFCLEENTGTYQPYCPRARKP